MSTSSRAARRGLVALVAVASLLLGTLAGPVAAAPDSRSTDFWLTFMENLVDQNNPATLTLFITGEEPTTGTVSVPGLVPPVALPFTVAAGMVTSVEVPMAAMLTGLHTIQDKGVHVQANADVTVYGLNRRANSTDAFLGLPTDVLGTDYLVMAYQNNNPTGWPPLGPSQFAVVATEPNTTVTIVPTASSPGRQAGVPYVVTLDAGQVWQGGAAAKLADVTGTSITSDKPVAVFGGSRCAFVPHHKDACDHLVEQLPPTSAWGQSFVTAPLATRMNGDRFRILAAQDGTEVTVNGALVATLNRSQHHERVIAGGSTITANGPVLVAQYSHSATYDGVTASDPFMMLVPPYEQFLAEYTVTTPPSGFATNYVNVVTADAGIGTITLDGSVVSSASFSPVGTSGFSMAQLPVSPGSHRLVGDLPFGVFVYGFAFYDSYGYPGGASFAPIAVATDLALDPVTADLMVGDEHCLTATVTDADAAPLEGVRVDFAVTGANPHTAFDFTDALGVVEHCYTGTAEGADLITVNAGPLEETAEANWTDDAPPQVDAGGDVSGDEGEAIALDGSVIDDFGATSSWSWAVSSADAGATCSFEDDSAAATTVTCTDDGTFIATLIGDDGVNDPVTDPVTVTVANVAPSATVLSPVAGGEFVRNVAVPLEVTIGDPGSNDTHTCEVDWGDGTVGAGTVDQGAMTCSGSHAYAVAGPYMVTVTVVDDDGGSDTKTVSIVVGEADGKVTGGGHLNDADGERLSFGLNAASTAGKGRGQLQLQVRGDRFHGDTVRNLVVFGSIARWEGDGRWNNAGGHTFLIRVTDGATDTLRVTVSDPHGAVVYDGGGNVAGGQITIHK
jgi:hypothetical protein